MMSSKRTAALALLALGGAFAVAGCTAAENGPDRNYGYVDPGYDSYYGGYYGRDR